MTILISFLFSVKNSYCMHIKWITASRQNGNNEAGGKQSWRFTMPCLGIWWGPFLRAPWPPHYQLFSVKPMTTFCLVKCQLHA